MYKYDYTKLLVRQKSIDLANELYFETRRGQFKTDFGLRDQIRKSAVSVSSNIAEGHNRGSDRDFVRFLYYAKGSVAEVLTQLCIASRQGYLSETKAKILIDGYNHVIHMLGKMISKKKA